MAIRIKYDGFEFEVDTVAEAAELHKHLAFSKAVKPALLGSLPLMGVPAPDRQRTGRQQPEEQNVRAALKAFATGLNENGRKIIGAMVASFPNKLTTEELSARSGLGTMSLPPVLKHIHAVARSAGVDSDLILSREQVGSGDGAMSLYRLENDAMDVIGPVALTWATGP